MSLMTKRYAALAEAHLRIAKDAQRRFGVANGEKLNEIDALEHLDRGARCFLVAEKRLKAADSYHKCAEACLRIGGNDRDMSAATYFAMSAAARESVAPHDASESYQRALELCCDAGHWELAGVLAYRIAVLSDREALYEGTKRTHKPHDETSDRVHKYMTATDLLGAAIESSGDTKKIGLQNHCLEQAAIDLALSQQRFDRAATFFESLAKRALDSNLKQANATRFFFRAALCYLAQDSLIFTRGKLKEYASYYPPFTDAAERRCIDDILNCFLQDKDDSELIGNSDSSSDEDTLATDDNHTFASGGFVNDKAPPSAMIGAQSNNYFDDRPEKYRLVPNLNDFVDICYDLATVRELNAFELFILKKIHQFILKRVAQHQRRLERRRLREERRKEKEANERQRRLRLARDAQSTSRTARNVARAKLARL